MDERNKVGETVARLRDAKRDWPEFGYDRTEAADLLEALAAQLIEMKAERDGWKVQLGKIAALVPISQIVRVTGTTKDLIEWLTDRVSVAARADAAESALARLRADQDAMRALLKRAYDALGEDLPLPVFNKLAFDLERALTTPAQPQKGEAE